MKPISVTIPGNPVPKPSTKFSSRNGKVVTWNSSTAYSKQLKLLILKSLTPEQQQAFFLKDLALSVKIAYFLPIAASKSDATKNLASWGILPHTTKPDIDNLTKFYNDVGNKVLWLDDRIIVNMSLSKRCSIDPRTEITIESMVAMKNTPTGKILSIFGLEDVMLLSSMVFDLNEKAMKIEKCSEVDPKDCEEVAELLLDLSLKFSKKLAKISKSRL